MKFLLFIGTFIFKHLWQLTRIHEKQVPACHLWSVIEINEDWLDDALPGGTRGGGGASQQQGWLGNETGEGDCIRPCLPLRH